MTATKWYFDIDRGLEILATEIETKVPDFKIENGKMIFNGQMPYYVVNEDEYVVIIDTTGNTNENVIKDSLYGYIVTKDSIIVKQGPSKIKKYSLGGEGTNLTKAEVVNFLSESNNIVFAFIFIAFSGVLALKMMNVLILVLYGMVLNMIFKTNLRFGQMMNFCLYAITLPMLLELVMFLSNGSIPYFYYFYWIISLSYVFMSIYMYRNNNKNNSIGTNIDLMR